MRHDQPEGTEAPEIGEERPLEGVSEDIAWLPRVLVAIDGAVPRASMEACREFVAALAEAIRERVAFVTSRSLRFGTVVHPGDSMTVVVPTAQAVSRPMSPADFVWLEDGRPDWGAMWTTFCDLALYGSPPHRGEEDALRAPEDGESGWSEPDLVTEMRRGVWETTGLVSEPGPPGWLAITCDSRRMAAWLCAAIILENVDARCEEERLLLPACPAYRLANEAKSIVTVVAKTAHYWQAHVADGRDGADQQ